MVYLHRPIIGLTVFFLLGNLAGSSSVLSAGMFLMATTVWFVLSVVLLAAIRGRRGRVVSNISVLAAAGLVGACMAAVRPFDFRPAPATLPDSGSMVTITGVVTSDPEPLETKSRGRVTALFQFETQQGGQARLVRIRWFGAAPDAGGRIPAYGEKWRLQGIVQENLKPAVQAKAPPGGEARCLKVIRVDSSDSEFVSDGHGFPPAEWCYRARRIAARRISTGIERHPESVGILRAMLLGYRSDLPSELSRVFEATGTIHVFAISGLHVGIVTMLITRALMILRVDRSKWVLFLIPLLAAYTLATGAKASSLRAALMATVYFTGPFLGRKPDAYSALAFAALAIVVIAPDQMFQAGFIFSFVVVTGLLLFIKPFHEILEPLWRKDPFSVLKEPVAVRILRWLGKGAAGLTAVSVAAWLSSAPLTAYYFGRLSPIALVGNILVIPAAFLIVLTGSLSLVAGMASGYLAETLNHANLAITWTLKSLTGAMASLPCASFSVSPPSAWVVWAWYALLPAILLLPWKRSAGCDTIALKSDTR